ncbi:DMT family transporter [Carboxydothermus hydrogenoformans]|uniref:Putative membrane protein n=1 Tax=Carboxydothermus hydrogenoformans (strain ATCC BAA-161 / DSM 6008 / Z-2901) TaxID=246194 RepID=Q3AAZ7_CARHZ|nr:DMT family transporter [Carboxydothermus hydrogenoformans]ABB15988.1 putative membrane protein [Carboxydothermus hydrogenoformans Z-2901]
MNKSYLYLGITVVLFSTYEVVGRALAGLVNPFQLNFLRFFFGGFVLLPVALSNIKRKNVKLTGSDFLFAFLIGLLNVVLSMSFLQIGINMTKASLAAAIFSSNPLFVVLFAYLILDEKLNFQKILGLFIGIVGVVIVFYKDLELGISHVYGILMLILAAVTYGLYTVLGKRFSQKTDSVIMNSFSFILGSVFLLPIILLKHYPLFSLQPKAILPMAYLTFFVTGLAYYTYFLGLTNISAGNGSMVFFIKPVLASFFAWAILGEKITFEFIAGTMVILLGIYIVQWAGQVNDGATCEKLRTLEK